MVEKNAAKNLKNTFGGITNMRKDLRKIAGDPGANDGKMKDRAQVFADNIEGLAKLQNQTVSSNPSQPSVTVFLCLDI